jgi:predicted branched-subunit amino acid permease
LARGLADSLSIGAGYVPIAISFGLTALHAKLPAAIAVLISVAVFAGASQFALIALLAAGGSFAFVVLTVLLMNIRHVFYGPALLTRIEPGRHEGVHEGVSEVAPERAHGSAMHGHRHGPGGGPAHTAAALPSPLLAFGLTDEVFASAIAKLPHVDAADRPWWYVGLQLGAYLSWIAGTVLGVALGQEVFNRVPFLRDALAFVLPALFFALLLEIRAHARRRVLMGAAIAAALASMYLPVYLAIVVAMLAGAAFGYRRNS